MARPPKSRWSIKWSDTHIFKAEQEGDSISPSCVEDWCRTLDSQLEERFGPTVPAKLSAASLNFSRCSLDDAALTKLLTYLYSRDITVQILKLFRNNITDSGAWAVGQFMAHSSQAVHEVHLSHNSISEEGAAALLELIVGPLGGYGLRGEQTPTADLECQESVSFHTNTAKQIAQYHCRLQAMRSNITADREEANLLRQNCRNDDRKKQSQQAQARKLNQEAELCKAHKAKLVVDVQTESDRVAALRAAVKTYEQRLKEVLERKVLAEAEVMAAKMSQSAQKEQEDETRNFTMLTGSDDEQEDDNEEEEARVLNELELSYEGLELSSIMPIPAAVRLATGHISHQDTMSKADIPETGFLEREGVEFGRWTRPSPSGNAEWTEEELEAEYGEHLRNLEKVLLELRQEQAEQAEEQRCQSRLAALKQKKREEAAAAAAVAGNRSPWNIGKWMRREKTEAPTPKVSVVSGF
ncbi:unnamed protein product, partial [Symbiodinium sp. CCMP2456]